MSFKLIWYAKGSKQRKAAMIGENPIAIGRDADNQITLQGNGISRRHAIIQQDGDRIILSDNGSRNGTFIGANKINRAAWAPGQKASVGNFIFELAQSAPGLSGTYQPLQDRARIVLILLSLVILFQLMYLGFNVWNYSNVSGNSWSSVDFFRNAFSHKLLTPSIKILMGVLLAIYAMVCIALVVTFLLWQRRATQNLQVFKMHRLGFSPTSAIVWWFVPIANFFQPMRAISELWRASHPDTRGANWKSMQKPTVVTVWWMLLLLSLILFSSQSFMEIFLFYSEINDAGNILPREVLDEFQRVFKVIVAGVFLSEILLIAASLLTIKIVNRVSDSQRTKWEKLKSTRSA